MNTDHIAAARDKVSGIERKASLWSFMQLALDSIYSYFLVLYPVLLKSIFYFNVFCLGDRFFCLEHMNEMLHCKVTVKIINAKSAVMVL